MKKIIYLVLVVTGILILSSCNSSDDKIVVDNNVYRIQGWRSVITKNDNNGLFFRAKELEKRFNNTKKIAELVDSGDGKYLYFYKDKRILSYTEDGKITITIFTKPVTDIGSMFKLTISNTFIVLFGGDVLMHDRIMITREGISYKKSKYVLSVSKDEIVELARRAIDGLEATLN